MLGAVGLAFVLLAAGACARAGFRYGWARLRELREALDIVEPEIRLPIEGPPKYLWRVPEDVQLVPSHGWFSHRDPKTLPEYLPHHASSEYDNAMRAYGDIKFLSEPLPEHLHMTWQVVQDAMRRRYEQMIMERKLEYDSRAV